MPQKGYHLRNPNPPSGFFLFFQVKNVADVASTHDETATLAYSEKPTSPIHAPASPYSYRDSADGYYGTENRNR